MNVSARAVERINVLTTLPMERTLLSLLTFTFFFHSEAQTPSVLGSVPIMATVDSVVPSITLHWSFQPAALGFTIYRRAVGDTDWTVPIATLPLLSTEFQDNAVTAGTGYEYKIERMGPITGFGYVRSGINVPPVEQRGAIVLLVESVLAAQLTDELERLHDDLLGDGWLVVRHDVPAANTSAEVRQLVIADHAANDAVRAVLIIGHVAVPYSGSVNPDGHDEHLGAWPCDAFYGDVDDEWTDTAVDNATSNFPWNHNVPGDGKWDQSELPSIELQVGRIDLSHLPSMGSEAALTSAYLIKAHAWKTRAFTVPATSVIWDNLTWLGTPVAYSGFSTAPCVGTAQLTELSPSIGQFREHYVNTDDLFTFHCSTGLQWLEGALPVFSGTDGGLNLSDLSGNSAGGVFNMSMGSYFGDWDNEDNFLRAMITSGNALAHMWCGIPNWFLHPMAMGEPIGYCALRTMNNTNGDYSLQNGGFQGAQVGRTHVALMGDPTLRMRYVAPPTAVEVTNEQWFVQLRWSPSPSTIVGYHIYRIDEANGSIVRITQSPVTDTMFVSSTVPFVPGDRYMVRALKLIISPSGSYHDLSLGAIGVAQGEVIADCEGVLGGPAIPGTPCDDDDPSTTGEVYDASCACALAIGMYEASEEFLHAWPTPASTELNLRTRGPGFLLLHDMNGALLRSTYAKRDRTVLDVQGLPAGLYSLEFRSLDGHTAHLRVAVNP